MKKIQDIINRLWNVCGQMEVGTLLTCGSGIKGITFFIEVCIYRVPFEPIEILEVCKSP